MNFRFGSRRLLSSSGDTAKTASSSSRFTTKTAGVTTAFKATGKSISFAWRNKVLTVLGITSIYTLYVSDLDNLKRKAQKSYKLLKVIFDSDEEKVEDKGSTVDTIVTAGTNTVDTVVTAGTNTYDALKSMLEGEILSAKELWDSSSNNNNNTTTNNNNNNKVSKGEIESEQKSAPIVSSSKQQATESQRDENTPTPASTPASTPAPAPASPLEIKDTVGWGVIVTGVVVAVTVPSPVVAAVGGGLALDGIMRKTGTPLIIFRPKHTFYPIFCFKPPLLRLLSVPNLPFPNIFVSNHLSPPIQVLMLE